MKRENLKLKSNKYRNQINTVKSCKTDVSSVSPLTKDLRTVPTIVIAHRFCASPDTRISYRQCLLIQGSFCAV